MENSDFKIYSSKEIEALFRTALENDHAMIPYLALAAFAGLRQGEIEYLRLTDIDFEARRIRVDGQMMKKHHIIYGIPEVAWLWLQYVRDKELADFASRDLSRRVRQLFRNAGVGGGLRCLRTSFVGHFCALTGDVCQVASVVGGPISYIHRLKSLNPSGPFEANAYFSVTPSRLLK